MKIVVYTNCNEGSQWTVNDAEGYEVLPGGVLHVHGRGLFSPYFYTHVAIEDDELTERRRDEG